MFPAAPDHQDPNQNNHPSSSIPLSTSSTPTQFPQPRSNIQLSNSYHNVYNRSVHSAHTVRSALSPSEIEKRRRDEQPKRRKRSRSGDGLKHLPIITTASPAHFPAKIYRSQQASSTHSPPHKPHALPCPPLSLLVYVNRIRRRYIPNRSSGIALSHRGRCLLISQGRVIVGYDELKVG